MKNALIYSTLLFIIFTCSFNNTKANTVAGGELIYIYLGDDQSGTPHYQIILKLHVDCGGSAAPDSMPLCVKNTCNNNIISQKMGRWIPPPPNPNPNGKIIGISCPNVITTCTNPSAMLTGYREYLYTGIVKLSTQCSKWVFSTHIANRNNSINLQNSASQPFYIEATFNNTVSKSNSSPYYSIKPEMTIEKDYPFSYSSGALDADGDSLVTYLVNAQTGVTACADTPKNMTFANANPSYNLINNPIQTNNTFALNPKTGEYGFIPNALGKSNITIRTDEYRNGVLIGSIMRDQQMQVVPAGPFYGGNVNVKCNNARVPDLTKPINICVNETFSFCYDVVSDNPSARLFISDNLASSTMSGSTAYYYNQGTDSVRVMFYWKPGINMIGLHSFMHTIADSTCTQPVVRKYAQSVDFRVLGQTKAAKDTTICEGATAFLNASGGGDYKWTVLAGGTTNSLNDSTIPNPIAYPTQTTSYAVRSTINEFCPSLNKDTVTVKVNAATTGADAITNRINCGLSDPGIDYLYICPEEQVSFCYTSHSSFSNASLHISDNISVGTPGAQISYSNQGTDTAKATFIWTPNANQAGIYTLILTTYDSACAKPNSPLRSKQKKIYFYVWPPVKINYDSLAICRNETIKLKAIGGIYYSWEEYSYPGYTKPTVPVITDKSLAIQTLNPVISTAFIVKSTLSSCNNSTDTVIVNVNTNITTPVVRISASPDSIISKGNNIAFTATVSGCSNRKYEWYVNGRHIPDYYGNQYLAHNLRNMDKVWCRVICEDSCPSPKDTISNIITIRVYNTGIAGMEDGHAIGLYPNPNNGSFTIQLNEALVKQQPLAEVVNIYGQVLYRTTVKYAEQQLTTNLPAGIYMLRVSTVNQVHTTRFTKQ